MNLRRIVCSIVVIFTFAFIPVSHAQVSTVAKKTAEACIGYFSKKSGKELLEYGGEKAVRKAFENISKTGGEKCAERALMYSKIYGLEALKTIEVSPVKVIEALERTPTKYKPNIFSIVKANGENVVKRLETEGVDFLILEAKFPNYGFKISELGKATTEIATKLDISQKDAFCLAKNVPSLKAVKKASPFAFSGFLAKLESAPKKTIEMLEKNPKVLFSGAALTAFLGAKEEFMALASSPLQYTLYGIGTLLVFFIGYGLYRIRHLFNKFTSPAK